MATWKKIIVSGSDAHLNSVTASSGIIVTGSSLFSGSVQVVTGNGTTGVTTGYQRIGLQSETQLSGSFTGSFAGSFVGTFNGAVSSSTLSSLTQGTVTSSINGVNQNVSIGVRPQDSPTFTDLTLSGDINVNGGDITTNAATFNVATTNASTINIGSNVSTVAVGNNLSVGGNLTVLGTVTEIQVSNLNVEDQFVLLASGSQGSPGVDGGIIVVSGSTAGVGSALYHDITDKRWAVATGVASNATSVTPLEYVATISSSAADPTVVNYGIGELHVNTSNGDIWIYS